MSRLTLDGQGQWTYDAITARYKKWCGRLHIEPRDLTPDPKSYLTQRGWLQSMMDEINAGMRAGDRACAWISIELLEEDGGFAFGKLMKARAARELKRFDLNEKQKQRIRARVLGMLQRQFMPHEFQFYARLVRKIGAENCSEDFDALCKSEDRWVRWWANIILGRNPAVTHLRR